MSFQIKTVNGRAPSLILAKRIVEWGTLAVLLVYFGPQYHLPELPRLNKGKSGFNWAGGAGRIDRILRILFCLSAFPDERMKTKSLREEPVKRWKERFMNIWG
jgi:hypothetical protein